jgi:primosomal protein N' (replication factor Y)
MPAEHSERVVRVLPDVSALRKTFDYTVPAALAESVRVGSQVRIALGPRRVGGWVVEDDVEPDPGVVLRPIAAVRGWGPPPEVLDLARWAAWRWSGPVPAFLRTASSPLAVRAVPTSRPPVSARPASEGPPIGVGLEGGTRVVRVAPAGDRWPILEALAHQREQAGAEAGALVLAPGHRAAGDVARRLQSAGIPVALVPGEWARARSGGCVVVGTRAAAFAPVPRLAGAVVLDAHDEAYHEERAPTWAAPVVVAERARRAGAPCALVSPCPTLEILALGPLVVGPRTVERRGWPPVEVIDRRSDDPRTGLFSERLVRVVRDVMETAGGRVVCVVNRTGRARLLACAACGELARCERCGAALELVDATRRARSGPGVSSGPKDDTGAAAALAPFLRCRRCSEERPVVCAVCGATRMKALRLGVSRVREDLEALVGVAVTEVWGPAKADEKEEDRVESARVVVGTEAALHRVHGADAVVFLEFDSELLAPRFRAAEQALGLLARAARLVSGAEVRHPGDRAPGRVVVQTRQPRHPALVSAVSADPGVLAGVEADVRRALDLPPFSALAVVSGPSAEAYGDALRSAAPATVAVRGPVDGAWSVRAPDHATLCDLLASVPRPPGRLRVEVDPVRA